MRVRTLLTTASAAALTLGLMAGGASAGSNDLVIEQQSNNNEADTVQIGSNNGQQSRNLSANMWATQSGIVDAAGAPANQNNQIVKQVSYDLETVIQDDPDSNLNFAKNPAFNALNVDLRTNKISQGGSGGNIASLSSIGKRNFFQVTQDNGDRLNGYNGGDDTFTQRGNNNVLLADQSGVDGLGSGGSTISGDQIGGNQNIATVLQTGNASQFSMLQDGTGNTIIGVQTDGGNSADVTQRGSNNKARSVQTTVNGNGFVSED